MAAPGSDARFEAAIALANAGRREEALTALLAEAKAGHPMAAFALGQALGDGRLGRLDYAAARAWCARAVRAGVIPARALAAAYLARGVGGAPDWPGAVDMLADAARHGEPDALRQWAQLSQMAGARDDAIWPFHAHAARQGDPVSQFWCAGYMQRQDRLAEAGQWYRAAQSAGHRLAGQALAALGRAGEKRVRLALPDPASPDPRIAAKLRRGPPGGGANSPRSLSDSPWVRRIDGFLDAGECAYLIGRASPHLRPAMVVDPRDGQSRPDEKRTSKMANFAAGRCDMVMTALLTRIAAVTRSSLDRGEPWSIMAYGRGEEYKPHHDALPESQDEAISQLKSAGQRMLTFLVYLNADYDGGATAFPSAGLEVTGRTGDALMFRNLTPDGAADPAAWHSGEPVTGGRKWLASLWIRERPYAARL